MKQSQEIKQVLVNSLVWMLMKEMQPLHTVENGGFQQFIKHLVELETTEYVSIATDIRTSNQMRAFLTVTAHCISPGMKLCSAVWKTSNLTSSHKAEYNAAELRNIF